MATVAVVGVACVAEDEREKGRRSEGKGRWGGFVGRGKRRRLREGVVKRGLKREGEGIPAILKVWKVAPPKYCGNPIVDC